jgi:hypothetical protein
LAFLGGKDEMKTQTAPKTASPLQFERSLGELVPAIRCAPSEQKNPDLSTSIFVSEKVSRVFLRIILALSVLALAVTASLVASRWRIPPDAPEQGGHDESNRRSIPLPMPKILIPAEMPQPKSQYPRVIYPRVYSDREHSIFELH